MSQSSPLLPGDSPENSARTMPYSQVPAARAPMSGMAIAGFVTSLVLCVPVVTAAAGIVLGAVAWPQTAPGHKRGRGFALAAIVIGIVGLLGWAAAGYGIYSIYSVGRDVSDSVGKPFVMALGTNNPSSAQGLAVAGFPPADVMKITAYLQTNYGPLQSIDLKGVYLRTATGTAHVDLDYQLNFANGKTASARLDVLRGAQGGPDRVYGINVK